MITKPRLVPVDGAASPAETADIVPASDVHVSHAVDTLARTLWGEARGEGRLGMAAVAAVIMNRVAVARQHGNRFWWGHDVTSVCRKPWQFSCWNEDDPNRAKLATVTADDSAFDTALQIARQAVTGMLRDLTAPPDAPGATHYHAQGITPGWAVGQRPIAAIGRHLFYRLAA